MSERWDDASDEVRQAEVALSRDPERRLAFEGTRALGEALAGRPLDALRVAAGVRRAAQVADMTIMRSRVGRWPRRWRIGSSAIVRGPCAELTALADAPAETMLFCRILAMSELAQAHLDEGELETARHVFAQAEALVEEESLGADVRGWLTRGGTVLAVAEGDLEAARRWADQVDDSFWGGVSEARVDLACGDRPAAMTALDRGGSPLRPPRGHPGTPQGTCSRRPRRGDEVRQRGRRDGLGRRPPADRGLRRRRGHRPRRAGRVARPGGVARPPAHELTAEARNLEAPAGPDLIEPLTERERDVLRFLPSRLTVREIADELYVSVNTLKFHLRVIYRKLGVNSRAEAAEVARTMTRLRR